MYYTRLLILTLSLLLLEGCATSPSSTLSPKHSNKEQSSIRTPSEVEITLYRQAITDLSNHNFAEAEVSFLNMIKKQPDLAGPWANLALVYIKQQQFEKAENTIQTALKKNPNMAQALNLAGYIANRKGRINEAKQFYEKAIINKPDYALAHYNLALLYDVYLQDISKALEYYQQYLSLISDEDKNTKDWVEELKLNIKSDDA